jgi:hypothetical protein
MGRDLLQECNESETRAGRSGASWCGARVPTRSWVMTQAAFAVLFDALGPSADECLSARSHGDVGKFARVPTPSKFCRAGRGDDRSGGRNTPDGSAFFYPSGMRYKRVSRSSSRHPIASPQSRTPLRRAVGSRRRRGRIPRVVYDRFEGGVAVGGPDVDFLGGAKFVGRVDNFWEKWARWAKSVSRTACLDHKTSPM